jgi:putative flippase GtrA
MLLVFAVVCAVFIPATVFGQESVPQASAAQPAEESRRVAFAKFIAGGAVGTAVHEAGHLAAGWDRYNVSRRHAIAVRSAGFWSQYLASEIVFIRHPHLRSERAPFRKGVLASHLAISTGYTVLAFARTGPYGRDTFEMAQATRIDERWIGALVLTPAVLDGIRYLRPEARWAAWLSRGVKVGSVALVLR